MDKKIYERTKYPNIFKHVKNGSYAVDLSLGYNEQGKRVRTTKTGIKTETEARRLLRDLEKQKNIKNKIINVSKFEDCIEEYYEWCILSEQTIERTLEKKKTRFKNHIIPFFKGLDLEKINETTILKWHKYLNEKDLAASTKNTLHRQLSAYFNWLLIHKKTISLNPVLSVKNYKIPSKIVEYRTVEQMNNFWNTIINDTKCSEDIKLRIYAITKFLFFSGLRFGELMGLKIKDIGFNVLDKENIDIDEIKIELSTPLVYTKGGWVKGKGKTKDSIGTIFVGKNVFKAVFDYLKYMEKMGYIFEKEDFIFTNPESKSKNEIKVFSPETIRDKINYFVNITPNFPHTKPKDMRSSHGTFLLSEGFTLEEVQNRLRHTRKETTEQYYATFYEENKKKLAKDIDKFAS